MVKVKVILPSGIKIEEECESITIPGIDGDFAVLEGHTPFITKIRPGVLSVDNRKNSVQYAIHDGFVTVEDNLVTVVTERLEGASEIDKGRAEDAMKRAKERLAQNSNESEVDFRRAEFALKRALTRIQAFSK